MITSQLVYRAGRGAVWHWPANPTSPAVSACTNSRLDPTRHRPPVAVDMRDRCTSRGCGRLWDEWLRATMQAALVDTINRWYPLVGPSDDPEVAA